jgi:hypothetical protein
VYTEPFLLVLSGLLDLGPRLGACRFELEARTHAGATGVTYERRTGCMLQARFQQMAVFIRARRDLKWPSVTLISRTGGAERVCVGGARNAELQRSRWALISRSVCRIYRRDGGLAA